MDETLEARLCTLLATDLPRGVEALVHAYQDRLFAFVYRLVGDRRDAEEIAQDTFVRAYRALAGYPAPRIQQLALRAWLFRIALNLVRNRARARPQRLLSLDVEEGAPSDPPDPEPSRPEALLLAAERAHELGAHLLALPLAFRVAVVLRHVEGLSYAEIADLLGQPLGTVKSNVHRGVLLLRTALAEQFCEVR